MIKNRSWKRALGVSLGLGMGIVFNPISIGSAATEWQVTEDQFSSELKLNLTLRNPSLILGPNGLGKAAEFFAYTNYPHLIAEYQLSIYSADDIASSRPLKTFTWKEDRSFQPIVWDGTLDSGLVSGGKEYKAILEVTGITGKKDISLPIFFDVIAADASRIEGLLRTETIQEAQEIPGYGVDHTAYRGIVSDVSYRKIVIQGSGVPGAATLNGKTVTADAQGHFVRELILPTGSHEINLTWIDESGMTHQQNQTINVEKAGKSEFFFVAQADLTVGGGSVNGHKEVLNGDYHYDSGVYADGRLAFYLKGTIQDQYRLTAHLDTGEERTNEMFGKLDQKDPRRVFRELDPNAHYPIYGDDSTLEQDVNTQGKFYFKLEKGKDHLLWGNYNTGMTGTEFGSYNRSLYGLQYFHEADQLTKFGDVKDYVNLFAATSESRASYNEFLSTGGSLYYLNYQRVTEGSAKLTAEVRDSDTGRVISRATLTEGTDYEIDNFQGRILLKKPLPMKSRDGSIISSGSLQNGNDVYLVVDFEYYSDDLSLSSMGSQGGRAYGWLGDHFRIGATTIRSEQDGSTDAYKFYSADLTWKPSANTYTYFEYGKSESGLGSFYQSNNGGLNFEKRTLTSEDSGSAYKIEQQIDFKDYGNTPLKFYGYYSRKNAGFNNLGTVADNKLTEYGAELTYHLDEDAKNGFRLRYSSKDEETVSEERRIGLQYYREFSTSKGLRGAIEIQDVHEWTPENGNADETLAAIKIEKDLHGGKDKVYLIQQVSLSHSDNVEADNKTTIGYETQIKDYLKANIEGIAGNRGSGFNGGLAWDVNPRTQLYSRYETDLDSTSGKSHTMTFGGNWKMTDKTQIYSERQFINRSTERSTADVYGVKYKPSQSEAWDISYSVEEARNNSIVQKHTSLTTRNVGSIAYSYKGKSAEGFHRLEYRREKGNDDLRQIVTTNRVKTVERDGWSLLGQLDYAHTSGSGADLANYQEFAFGFAYRPVRNDRFNLFGKVTYIGGLEPDSQFISTSNGDITNDYEQKSVVYAVEGVYEISSKWEVAFKAAKRDGRMRQKGESEWLSSGAELYAVRANYSLNKHWDALVEYRTLRVATANDHKDGWLAAIYRKVGSNAKVGVGYNWTDYNDDLTRLNYNSHGWFVNIVGTW